MSRPRREGTKLLVECPGCGKERTLIRQRIYLGKPWTIRHHDVNGKRCSGSGQGYRRGDPGVKEVMR